MIKQGVQLNARNAGTAGETYNIRMSKSFSQYFGYTGKLFKTKRNTARQRLTVF